MLKVVHDGQVSTGEGGSGESSLLDSIVRDGARQMLAAALQAEVAAYIEVHRGEVGKDGHQLVVRNGSHEPREVTTAAGAVPGDRSAGQRQACRRGHRATAPVLLGDLAGVVA